MNEWFTYRRIETEPTTYLSLTAVYTLSEQQTRHMKSDEWKISVHATYSLTRFEKIPSYKTRTQFRDIELCVMTYFKQYAD